MLYKASGSSTNILITDKMGTAAAAATPLAIGTRGTVGSLVRREIEYFRRIEVDHATTTKKPEPKTFDYFRKIEIDRATTTKKPESRTTSEGVSYNSSNSSTSSSTSSRFKSTTLGSLLTMSWRRRRRRSSNNNSSSSNNNSSFLPSMCSAVEVSESKRFDVIPGFSYRNLKADIQKTVD